MIHVSIGASATVYDLLDTDGWVRLRVELALFCDSCHNHVDLPEGASVVSVPLGDLETVMRAHEARGCV